MHKCHIERVPEVVADIPKISADRMAKAVERVTEAFALWMVDNGQIGVVEASQVIRFMNELPLEEMILDTFGFQGDLDMLEADQLKLLKNFERVAPLTGANIQALIDVNQATFMQLVGRMAGTMKTEMTKAVLGGVAKNKIVKTVAAAAGQSLSSSQVKTLVDTAMKTFTRQVNAVMSEALPADTLYVYVGKTDEKTRPICLAMLAAGALERSEIEEQFPGTFVDGGGFNCRHRWAVKTDFSEKFNDQDEARVRLSAQGIDPSTLQTPQQQAGL